MEQFITAEYLEQNPNHIFVFGDNLDRRGTGGAAVLRHYPNTYGFVTKKRPTYNYSDFYTIDEYRLVYEAELVKLIEQIKANPDKLFLISKLGGGLANRHKIYENVIGPRIRADLMGYSNVKFLFD